MELALLYTFVVVSYTEQLGTRLPWIMKSATRTFPEHAPRVCSGNRFPHFVAETSRSVPHFFESGYAADHHWAERHMRVHPLTLSVSAGTTVEVLKY